MDQGILPTVAGTRSSTPDSSSCGSTTVQLTWMAYCDFRRIWGTACSGAGSRGRRFPSAVTAGWHKRLPAELDVAATARLRDEVWDWADTRVSLPIDPEHGSRLGTWGATTEAGGAAVSLVVSHSVADGRAVSLAIADAVQGDRHDLGYPPPGARTARSAVVRGPCGNGSFAARHRARIGCCRQNREPRFRRMDSAGRRAGLSPASPGSVAMSPWRYRRQRHGRPRPVGPASGNAWRKQQLLFLGLVARLAQGMGRVDGAGRVVLVLPVSDRRAGDRRANALSVAKISVDPAAVTETLSALRKRGGRCAGRGARNVNGPVSHRWR